MKSITEADLKNLYLPPPSSHKGQNGKLLIIGGSHLFHAASLWALKVASRIVDLVHYSSVPENNEIVQDLKEEFRDGIIVPREEVANYIDEDDAILIGPGMTRDEETRELTNRLLKQFPKKQWIIDAGALQMMDVTIMPPSAIVTPHHREFVTLFGKEGNEEAVVEMVKRYNCIILLKGEVDIVCSKNECWAIRGGNSGMTKGGTGDVLAGLIAALTCKNDPFLATIAGSFINKKAGDALFKRVGPFFSASDLADEIPKVMKELIL